MKRICYALALVMMLTTGCSDGKGKGKTAAEEPEEEPLPERFENDDLPKAADELFNDFVYYFASNEQLQRRRIMFPLKVNDNMMEEQEWQMDPFFMNAGEYTQIFDAPEQRELANDTTIDKVFIEKIFLSKDSVRQYAFNRDNGRWQMTGIEDLRLKDNPYATFLTFYQEFASDSAFQQKSLKGEIEFSSPDPNDESAMMEGFITPDSWEAFAPELPQDSIYNIVYGEQNGRAKEKIFVICGISNGLEIELTFRQERGKWKLAKLTE